MADSNAIESTPVEELKQVELIIHEVEDFAIIVNVGGWRMRAYYDVDFNYENLRFGQSISLNYYGDIDNPFTIRFEKLK